MLIIEFSKNLGQNIVLKYRHVNEICWCYLFVDIETLNLLVKNFGIYSTVKNINYTRKFSSIDNMSTSKDIYVKYCGAEIKISCQKNTYQNISALKQNY